MLCITKRLEREIKTSPIPQHIAFIMDGNRRFAAKKRISIKKGHSSGKNKLKELLQWLLELKVHKASFFVLSNDNIKKRSNEEISNLFELCEEGLWELYNDTLLDDNHVNVQIIGNIKLLPDGLVNVIDKIQRKTEKYRDHVLKLCIAYDGRTEIVETTKKIAEKCENGTLNYSDIDSNTITENGSFSDVHLLIRTSGEIRISNFMLWDLAYAELYFSSTLWPDFSKTDLFRAIKCYQSRKLRLGA